MACIKIFFIYNVDIFIIKIKRCEAPFNRGIVSPCHVPWHGKQLRKTNDLNDSQHEKINSLNFCSNNRDISGEIGIVIHF